MSGNIRKLFDEQKALLLQDKNRLCLPEKKHSRNKNYELRSPYCGMEPLDFNDTEVHPHTNKENFLVDNSSHRVLSSNKNYELRSPYCDNQTLDYNDTEVHPHKDKENFLVDNNNHRVLTSNKKKQTLPLSERLNLLSCNEATVEGKKLIFIDSVANSEGPFSENRADDRFCGAPFHAMLRYGEFSPNNPQLRVPAAAPYLGLGEYEQRRNLYLQRQRADYLDHLAKKTESLKAASKSIITDSNKGTATEHSTKSVQTELQNIDNPLIQYDIRAHHSPEKDLSHSHFEFGGRRGHNFTPRTDQRLTSAQNVFLNAEMDKPKSILSNRRTGSPRSRYTSDYSSYVPSFMDGFSYSDPTEELERERLKRDSYQRELRLQIEEKRRLQHLREDQERRERELENKKLEQQILRMQEEKAIDDHRRSRRDEQMRRHSDDLLRRKHEIQSRPSWRKHTGSESSLTGCLRNCTETSSKSLAHYSPPVSRRNPYSFNIPSSSVFHEPASRYNNPSRYESSSNRYESSYYRRDTLNRIDSLNTYETVPGRHKTFSRFDSLSRIDCLNQRLESMSVKDTLSETQRRHSATQQDLSVYRRSPRLRRRSSSSRFEDSLPVPVLKAHSPVARELKHSVPFSSRSSEALRKLEDRWQVPAVQKNIVNPSGGILTQLGAIRMQLQQEQLRMDETLRRRGITQPKAVDFH